MKKMKGLAPVMEPSPYIVPEDPRIRFKHQSLMQDYQDLQKETNAMKKKMEMLKQRKFTLLAEVQFLRQRYEYLMDKQLSSPQQPQNRVNHKSSEKKSDNATKSRSSMTKGSVRAKSSSSVNVNKKVKIKNGRKVALQNPMPILNSKQERTIGGKEAACHNSVRVLDLNERDVIPSGRDFAVQTPALAFDVHHKERLRVGREVTKRNPTPIFDLNQVSTEELQISDEQPRTEEVSERLARGGSEDYNNDMKLASFRTKNTANGLKKVGKRKISWQDQVALRV